jgi:hypothetical protein
MLVQHLENYNLSSFSFLNSFWLNIILAHNIGKWKLDHNPISSWPKILKFGGCFANHLGSFLNLSSPPFEPQRCTFQIHLNFDHIHQIMPLSLSFSLSSLQPDQEKDPSRLLLHLPLISLTHQPKLLSCSTCTQRRGGNRGKSCKISLLPLLHLSTALDPQPASC